MSKNKVKKNNTNLTPKTEEDIREDILEDGELNFEQDKSLAPKSLIPKINNPYLDLNFNGAKILGLVLGLLVIAGVIFSVAYFIPNNVLNQTEEAVAKRKQVEASESSRKNQEEKSRAIEDEKNNLTFTDRSVNMEIVGFGDLKIDMKDKAAPKTVENYLRLVYRKKYDGNNFHRIVKQPNFAVIQGGDITANDGTGGETATGEPVPDELWEVKPEFETNEQDQTSVLKNQPKFSDPSLYDNFNTVQGTVTYRKGLILMAKTSAPDSATSQYFITLENTLLPAQYTVFGVIRQESFPVLDKINSEVNAVTPTPNPEDPEAQQPAPGDGAPDKELRTGKVALL